MANAFPLRLPVSMRLSANEIAASEGISLNLFIAMAVAEKIIRLKQGDLHDAERPSIEKKQL